MTTTIRCRILLVDDNALLRRVLHEYLHNRGAHVTEADSALAALDHLERQTFDAVVTDLDMPGPSGLWLLQQVRDRWHDTPVILITGRLPAAARDTARGADAVLLKPFSLRELDARIRTLVSG